MPNLIPLLPVEDNWSCKRSGDCCRLPAEVLMTEQERDVLQAWADKNLTLKELGRIKFAVNPLGKGFLLQAGPCPFLKWVDAKPECQVRDIRPYNCRRFHCMRPDPQREPMRFGRLRPGEEFGEIGCLNLRIRLLQSRVARRLYDKLQRKAQKWGYRMGWS